jgi:2-dehydropantoate 2-reductase
VDYDARLFASSSTASNPLPSLSATPTTDATPLEHTLAALLSLDPLNTSLLPIPKMYHTLLLKLSTNCAVNPLTALLGVQNGALIGPSQTQSVMRAVLGEASEAITRYLASVRDDNEPLDPETIAMFSPSALERRTMAVLSATARNTSSMASDLSRLSRGADVGTEIEYINGFLVRLGERMGLEMPVNRMLAQMVGAKEEIARISPGLLLRSKI